MTGAVERRALLVGVDPGAAARVRERLAAGDVRWRADLAGTLAEAAGAIEREAYDLVLADAGPDGEAEAARAVRHAVGEVPVVVLRTGDGPPPAAAGGDGPSAEPLRLDEVDSRRLDRAVADARRERAARRADRMAVLGRVVGGVAHEYNNLLTAVLGYAQLLEADAGLDAEQREGVAEILRAARRAAAITRPLLAYRRRAPGPPVPVAPDEVLRGLRPLLESVLGRRIALEIALDPAPGLALADRARLEHALLHLVANARDAMEGGGTVTVSTTTRTLGEAEGPAALGAGAWTVIEVADDGVGMDEAILRRAREPFFTTRGGREEAAGLGLAVVDAFAHDSGGTLEIESRAGEGTTARLWLPVAEP